MTIDDFMNVIQNETFRSTGIDLFNEDHRLSVSRVENTLGTITPGVYIVLRRNDEENPEILFKYKIWPSDEHAGRFIASIRIRFPDLWGRYEEHKQYFPQEEE